MLLRPFASALFLVSLLPVSLCAASRTSLIADETSPTTQNTRADDDNLSRIQNVAMLNRFVRAGYLVSVPASGSHYYVHGVPAQYRYTRPWTKLFLARLSRQYYAKFGKRLRVTSLVRTEGRQRRLTRVNANAADAVGDSRSSHLTGATIDVSKRFMSAAERRWMRDVLYSLHQQGYVYAIEEFYQPTFHIMVFRGYPKYVTLVTRKSLPAADDQELAADSRGEKSAQGAAD